VLLSVGSTPSQALLDELARLGVDQVILVGGTAAVPAGVESGLASRVKVRRVAGADRYATAAAVSNAMSLPLGSPVWIANGSDPTVALAAAAAAGAGRGALLLTEAGALPASTQSALRRILPARVVIAGDTRAVSDAVVAAVRGISGTVTRAAGTDAYATAVALAGPLSAGTPIVYVASGTSWPDSVSASWAAGADRAPLLLVDRDKVPAPTSTALRAAGPHRLMLIGGTAAISTPTEGAIRSYVG